MVDKITTAVLTPAANLASPMGQGADKVAGVGGQSFAALLQNIAEESVKTGTTSEVMGAKALAREAELVDVVTSVTNAEVTLETVMAIRDRLIQAYQEILKMPI